jgi:NAD(P)-dependent dehydrogenase (short-subunit alcohol dehydrogenase family)
MAILSDQVAIITGAARGIGAGIAELLAQHGATVIISDANAEGAATFAKQLRAQGYHAVAQRTDVTSAADRHALVDSTLTQFGRIDILVNNAGVLAPVTLDEMTEIEWDRLMGINLKAAFFCAQAVLPTMRAAQRGRIVNIASMSARTGGLASPMHYVTAKTGMLGLTRGLARLVAPFGITVNSICPGFIETDMASVWTPETRERLVATIPLGRFGTAQDVAGAAFFLCSPYADYVTGITLDVNGGSHIQ